MIEQMLTCLIIIAPSVKMEKYLGDGRDIKPCATEAFVCLAFLMIWSCGLQIFACNVSYLFVIVWCSWSISFLV